MSIVVSVAVAVEEDGSTYVNVVRAESVLPVSPRDPELPVGSQQDIDIIDLARAALGRLAADAIETADRQVFDLRELLGKVGEP